MASTRNMAVAIVDFCIKLLLLPFKLLAGAVGVTISAAALFFFFPLFFICAVFGALFLGFNLIALILGIVFSILGFILLPLGVIFVTLGIVFAGILAVFGFLLL